jgi:hypothetical protein
MLPVSTHTQNITCRLELVGKNFLLGTTVAQNAVMIWTRCVIVSNIPPTSLTIDATYLQRYEQFLTEWADTAGYYGLQCWKLVKCVWVRSKSNRYGVKLPTVKFPGEWRYSSTNS